MEEIGEIERKHLNISSLYFSIEEIGGIEPKHLNISSIWEIGVVFLKGKITSKNNDNN